jgi:peptidoglycan/xylan/chitin deacetylase (PgdA/CDA1 family)
MTIVSAAGTTPVIPVLMYHAVGNRATRRFAPFVVPPSLLQEHLAALHLAGYQAVTITRLIEVLSSGVSPLPRLVCITFDDAFADLADAALPVLQTAAVSVTLYVPTAFVGRTAGWLVPVGEGSRRLLTWRQLAEVTSEGVECGAHGHRHLELDTLTSTRVIDEVQTSKDVLEDRLSCRVTSFCYPFGYHNASVRNAVRTAGFTSACAVGYRLHPVGGDPLAIQRLLVTRNATPTELLAMVQGKYRSSRSGLNRLARPAWRSFRRIRFIIRGPSSGGAEPPASTT